MKPEQLTAWALDELEADEKAQIEALLKEDGEAQGHATQTKSFCDFLSAELGGEDALSFTVEQRQQLETAHGLQQTEAPAAPDNPAAPAARKAASFWRRHALVNFAAAAAVVLMATVLVRHQMQEEDRMAEARTSVAGPPAKPEKTAELEALTAPATAPAQAQAPADAVPAEGGKTEASDHLQAAKRQMEIGDFEGAKNSFEEALRRDPANAAARTGMVKAEQKRNEYFGATRDPQRARMLNMVNEAWEHAPNVAGAAAAPAIASSSAVPAAPSSPPGVGMKFSTGHLHASDGFGGAPSVSSSTFQENRTRDSVIRREGRLVPVAENNTESYTPIQENTLKDVMREPLSTFSIDVDTASYANVRRFLNQNTMPPRDAVRIEELVNYFPAGEKGPAADARDPFAVRVEMADCPWQPGHRLARIAIKGREIGQDRKPGNLVFLVDVSGSMNQPDKLPLVKQSLRMLAAQLGENDRVSLVTYANGTEVILPSVSGLSKGEIVLAIDRLQAGGGTHGSAGIRLAYEQAVAGFIQGGVNRVILCTDGDFNVGISDPRELETFITEKARSGVFLSVLGYGSGDLQDRTMETLADKGNGNYAYIDSLSEARKVLVEQMDGTLVTIAKDVKIQVEFNPAVVRSYRLIGYENRLLAKEDFNDDTKDAGEIGAGHSVTALYELVPASLPPGTDPRPVVDELKYQKSAAPVAAAAEAAAPGEPGEAMTVKLRYKTPEGSVSQLTEVPVQDVVRSMEAAGEELKFSAAVAGFGLLLRGSSYAGQLTWDQVRQLAQEGKGKDELGYRGEFLQLIEKARGVSRH